MRGEVDSKYLESNLQRAASRATNPQLHQTRGLSGASRVLQGPQTTRTVDPKHDQSTRDSGEELGLKRPMDGQRRSSGGGVGDEKRAFGVAMASTKVRPPHNSEQRSL
jgi:hypothetical protein